MGKLGELEYQYNLQEAFKAVENQKWDWAQKEFKKLLKDTPSVPAYTGLILCELRITAFHPNAVFVPGGVNAFPCPAYSANNKRTWYCDNMKELESEYVVEPYFTKKDFENCFVIDEELHGVYEWFYYLFREKRKFIDWWNTSDLVEEADMIANAQQKQEYKEFYDGVMSNYQLWLDLSQNAINNGISRKIRAGYKNAIAAKNIIDHNADRNINIKPRANSKMYDVEYTPAPVITEKENPKTKFVLWGTLGVFALILILCSIPSIWNRSIYPWLLPMALLTLASVFIDNVYKLAKKLICKTPGYETLQEKKYFKLAAFVYPFTVLIPTITFSSHMYESRVFYALLIMCVPAISYNLAKQFHTKKQAVELLITTSIVACLATGFPLTLFSSMENWGVYATQYSDGAWFPILVVPFLLHLVCIACIKAASSPEMARITFYATTIQHVLHVIIYDFTPFEFNNFLFRGIWFVLFAALWVMTLAGCFPFIADWLSRLPKNRGNNYSGGYDSSDDDSSTSSVGYDYSTMYQPTQSSSDDSYGPYDAADANARDLGFNDANDAANQTGLDRKDFY